MKFIKQLFGPVLGRLFGKYLCQYVDEIPDNAKQKTLYITHDEGHSWLAAMVCPCGCGNTMFLNLLKETRPCWTVSVNDYGYPSLSPSVWRQKGCHSHFFLKQGKILWTK